MMGTEWLSVDKDFPAVGSGDLVEDADKCGFASAIGPEKTVDALLGHVEADVVKCQIVGIAFGDVDDFYFHGWWLKC